VKSWHGDREKSIAAGMDDHISKPVMSAELKRVLDHYLSNSNGAPAERVSADTEALVEV